MTATIKGATPVVTPDGEIDLTTVGFFEAAVAGAAAVADQIEIDLSKVSFMDARGLSVLVGAYHRLGDDASAVVVRDPSPTALLAMTASGVDSLVHLRTDRCE